MDTDQAQAHEGNQSALPGIDDAKDPGEEVVDLEAKAPPFSWVDDAADIAITEQLPIAIYTNEKGDVVIRQRDEYSDPEDQVVIVRVTDAAALAQAILDRARIE